MIRATLGDGQYWRDRKAKDLQWIERASKTLVEPSANPAYRAQFAFDFAKDNLRAAMRTYSRGDNVAEMAAYFPGVLDAWELSNAVADEFCAENALQTCRDWRFELTDVNHYIWCFWLVGLALALSVPRAVAAFGCLDWRGWTGCSPGPCHCVPGARAGHRGRIASRQALCATAQGN